MYFFHMSYGKTKTSGRQYLRGCDRRVAWATGDPVEGVCYFSTSWMPALPAASSLGLLFTL